MDKRIEKDGRTWINRVTTYDRGLFYMSLFVHQELNEGHVKELDLLIEETVTRYLGKDGS